MGVIRCCLVKGQKGVQSLFQLPKIYKMPWCLLMMEDGELSILHLKKNSVCSMLQGIHWQNVTHIEVISTFSQSFYLPSEQEDTICHR